MSARTYIDMDPAPDGAWHEAYRLLPCPNGHGWCDSSCAAGGHDTPWALLVKTPAGDAGDVEDFLHELRGKLKRGQNHAVDIARRDGEGFHNWHWVTRGEDIADVDAWVGEVRDLLTRNQRLRLYGDDHPDLVSRDPFVGLSWDQPPADKAPDR